jgi:hypothetical protein
VTLVEILLGAGLLLAMITGLWWFFSYGRHATDRVGSQVGAQQEARRAMVMLMREIREGMEVLTPKPGATLSWALIRDKLSCPRMFYQIARQEPSGRTVYDLWRFVDDPAVPAEQRRQKLIEGLRRLTFTSRGEGALQLHIVVGEGDAEQAFLTPVRLRNLAAAEELF